jgi:hypothetical protein
LNLFPRGSGTGSRFGTSRVTAIAMKHGNSVDFMGDWQRRKCLKTLERVKGIEPSYSAWKGVGG